jgi:outer membrane protein TolC
MHTPLAPAAARPPTSSVAGRTARLLLAFSLIPHPAAHAADAALTLAEAQRIAAQNSPLLAAQRSAVTAAEETAAAARELPDPKLRLGIDNLPLDGEDRYSLTRDFMTMRRIGVMQDFVRGSKRELKGRRAEHEYARERATLGSAQAALRRDVAATWVERYFSGRMAAVVGEQIAETELQLSALQAGQRAGRTQPPELLAVQASRQSLIDRRADYEKQSARAAAMLARWLGPAAARPPAAPPGPFAPAVRHDLADHVRSHPHLQSLDSQIAVADSDTALARAAAQPDWSMELAYAQRGPRFSNMLSFQVSIDLPLFQASRQDRGIAAKMAQAEQARALREDTLRQHLAEAEAAWIEWSAATGRLKRFDESLLPLARERVQLALAAYRGGQGTLAAVLEARRAELDLRLQQLQLAAEQGRAYAQLLYFLPQEDQP